MASSIGYYTLATLCSLQAHFRYCRFLIIDEKSIIGLKTLGLIDERLREIFPERSDELFGGLNVLICGDFYQIPPVGQTSIFTTKNMTDPLSIRGKTAYAAFNKTARLVTVVRQQGEDDEARAFRTALDELRYYTVSVDSWKLLSSRCAYVLSRDEQASFSNALRLFFTRDKVAEYNQAALGALNMPVKHFKGLHTGTGAASVSTDEADGLSADLTVAIGSRVMLSTNLWTERGLVNGATGTVRDITWEAGKDPSIDLPLAIMVHFDDYSGPSFEESNAVPIFLQTKNFEHKKAACTRTQFPLRLAYAITVHESQGLTLNRAVVDISDKETTPGLSYVAVSRVKKLSGVIFVRAFTHDRFQATESRTRQDRDIDARIRNGQYI